MHTWKKMVRVTELGTTTQQTGVGMWVGACLFSILLLGLQVFGVLHLPWWVIIAPVLIVLFIHLSIVLMVLGLLALSVLIIGIAERRKPDPMITPMRMRGRRAQR